MQRSLLTLISAGFSLYLSGQLPTIHSATILPANPGSSSHVKIVTHLETPNSAFLVDRHHVVTQSPQSIRLHLCYADGMSTVISHHTDTFAVGQLPQGTYTVHLSAYMSSAGQHCARVDSNFATFHLTVGSIVGIEETGRPHKPQLFPNPAHDQVTIEGAEMLPVRIFSLQGQLLRSGETSPSGTFLLRGLPPGMYLLQVNSRQAGAVQPFFIE